MARKADAEGMDDAMENYYGSDGPDLRAANAQLRECVADLADELRCARFNELGTDPPDDCPCGSQCIAIRSCHRKCSRGRALDDMDLEFLDVPRILRSGDD